MNKVFVLAPNESWIVDRFVIEFNQDNSDIIVKNPYDADVIWLFADWCSNQIPYQILQSKKVITTTHHIVPEKFGQNELIEFQQRDAITTVYHVPNIHTAEFIRPLTTKPIQIIPYWCNNNIWKITGKKRGIKQKYSIPENKFIIGSFQRDTEGAGIPNNIFLPKLEKGPDLLADFICKVPNAHVVLAGWRRQYIISRLKKASITYSYFENPSQQIINELYQTIDLYPIASRYEGGPQSLLEAGALNVPVVSRDVGMATFVLPMSAINDDISLAKPAVPNVEILKLPTGYKPYRSLIESL